MSCGDKPATATLQVDESVLELMRRHGASEEDLALAEQVQAAQQGAQVFEVWEENWAHWSLFLKVQTRWVHAGMEGVRVALDLPSVRVVANALGFRGKAWNELVESLLVIELQALAAWAKRREKDKAD